MQSGLHYFPLAAPAFLGLVLLLLLLSAFVASRLLTFASESMGLAPHAMIAVLLLSLCGSYINIPIAYLPERHTMSAAVVTYYGMPYVIPVMRSAPTTILAVNVGGALIPAALSLYLILRNQIFWLAVVGTAAVALVCHLLARPEPGIGIAEPIFVPTVTTAVVALLLSRRHAGALAYICGSLGTLVGADLLNLGRIRGLGAPVASIGGAGTFDGIFVIGLLSVVYAGWFAGRTAHRSASRS